MDGHRSPLDDKDPLLFQAVAGGQELPTKMMTNLARMLSVGVVGRQRHPVWGWRSLIGIQLAMTVAILAVTAITPTVMLPSVYP